MELHHPRLPLPHQECEGPGDQWSGQLHQSRPWLVRAHLLLSNKLTQRSHSSRSASGGSQRSAGAGPVQHWLWPGSEKQNICPLQEQLPGSQFSSRVRRFCPVGCNCHCHWRAHYSARPHPSRAGLDGCCRNGVDVNDGVRGSCPLCLSLRSVLLATYQQSRNWMSTILLMNWWIWLINMTVDITIIIVLNKMFLDVAKYCLCLFLIFFWLTQ